MLTPCLNQKKVYLKLLFHKNLLEGYKIVIESFFMKPKISNFLFLEKFLIFQIASFIEYKFEIIFFNNFILYIMNCLLSSI